jgi:hypothetical protein
MQIPLRNEMKLFSTRRISKKDPKSYQNRNRNHNNEKNENSVDIGIEPAFPFDSSLLSSFVILEKGKSRLFKDGGNPIVYGGAVKEVVGDPKAGVKLFITRFIILMKKQFFCML